MEPPKLMAEEIHIEHLAYLTKSEKSDIECA